MGYIPGTVLRLGRASLKAVPHHQRAEWLILALCLMKILAYCRPLQRPQGWGNLAARRGHVEGPWTLWRYTRAL